MSKYPANLDKVTYCTTDKLIRKKKKIRSRNLKLFFMTCIWILFSATIAFSINDNAEEYQDETTMILMISEGDTLWSIGEKYCPDDMDIRKYIHQIQKLNHMDNSTLYVDETLIIPIKD